MIKNESAELMTNPVAHSDANKGVIHLCYHCPFVGFVLERSVIAYNSGFSQKTFYARFSPGFRRCFDA